MKVAFVAVLVLCLSPAHLCAQSTSTSADPAGTKAAAAASVGVLIGLDRLYDAQKPSTEMPTTLEDKKSAAYERQWEENKKAGQDKPVRYDTKPEDSPYATVWIEWSPAGAKIRLLRDIIVPRKDGFWRFGVNHSSTKSGGDDNDQEFFWMARIGTEPQLTRAEELQSLSQASTRRLTYIDPHYFSYRELGQSWGGTYGESEYASVRSLDEFAKAAPKESDYGWEHPGMPLATLFGQGAQAEFDRITQQGVPKDSEQEQANQPAADGEEDPCAGAGYRTSETNWNIIHAKDRWIAMLALQSTGAGTCGRQVDWQALTSPLPSSIQGCNGVLALWDSVGKSFPGAWHAFCSPRADWIIVLTRSRIYLAQLRGSSIEQPALAADIPYGVPVMAQWSVGKYVALWDNQLSKAPPPGDDVEFTSPSTLITPDEISD